MLKRAIAMSLEQEEGEEPSSFEGKLLNRVKIITTTLKTTKDGLCKKSFQLFS